jgi:transposase
LSAQRPLWRAYQQDPEKVERWLREEFPRIRALARSVNAEIWFGDEAGVRSDAHAGTTWAPRGRTPIVSSTGARFGLNLISAVSRRGEFRFMGVAGRVNADVFLEFLRRLLHGAERPIFLIVDRHSTHRAAKVARFLETVDGRLRLFFLPPYSPELNPDEHVWNDLKNNGIGRMALDGPDHLRREVLGHLRHLQRSPDLIRSFFRAPFTSYAA